METILALSLVTNIGANAAVKAASLAARNTDTAMARLGSGTRIGAARDAALQVWIAPMLDKRRAVVRPATVRRRAHPAAGEICGADLCGNQNFTARSC